MLPAVRLQENLNETRSFRGERRQHIPYTLGLNSQYNSYKHPSTKLNNINLHYFIISNFYPVLFYIIIQKKILT